MTQSFNLEKGELREKSTIIFPLIICKVLSLLKNWGREGQLDLTWGM